MTNLLQRRTFSLKLLLICILPVLLITAILLYLTLRNSEAMLQELWMVIVAGALLIAGYGALAVFFVIGVRRRVQAVGQAIQQLSMGAFKDTVSINGNDEITAMASGVNTLGISLKGKTLFAEQIKAGNLDAQFDAGEGDQLSAALLMLKDNLLSIRNEEQKRNWANDGLTRFGVYCSPPKTYRSCRMISSGHLSSSCMPIRALSLW